MIFRLYDQIITVTKPNRGLYRKPYSSSSLVMAFSCYSGEVKTLNRIRPVSCSSQDHLSIMCCHNSQTNTCAFWDSAIPKNTLFLYSIGTVIKLAIQTIVQSLLKGKGWIDIYRWLFLLHDQGENYQVLNQALIFLISSSQDLVWTRKTCSG